MEKKNKEIRCEYDGQSMIGNLSTTCCYLLSVRSLLNLLVIAYVVCCIVFASQTPFPDYFCTNGLLVIFDKSVTLLMPFLNPM